MFSSRLVLFYREYLICYCTFLHFFYSFSTKRIINFHFPIMIICLRDNIWGSRLIERAYVVTYKWIVIFSSLSWFSAQKQEMWIDRAYWWKKKEAHPYIYIKKILKSTTKIETANRAHRTIDVGKNKSRGSLRRSWVGSNRWIQSLFSVGANCIPPSSRSLQFIPTSTMWNVRSFWRTLSATLGE